MFLISVILIWVVALGIWWLCSNAFRHADVDRFKNRLLGTSKAKKDKSHTGPALIHTDAPQTIVMKLLHRSRWQTRVLEMLEQSGLKWTVAKLLNTCLFLFGAAFGLYWSSVYEHTTWTESVVHEDKAYRPPRRQKDAGRRA